MEHKVKADKPETRRTYATVIIEPLTWSRLLKDNLQALAFWRWFRKD